MANRLYAHYEDFQIFLKLYDPTIILIQETNLGATQKFQIKNYLIYRKELDHVTRAHGSILSIILVLINFKLENVYKNKFDEVFLQCKKFGHISPIEEKKQFR